MPRPIDEPLEFSLRRTEGYYVRLALWLIGGLCLLVAVCWGGRLAYVHWQERTLMRQAHAAFDRNDFRWASLAAQRAFAVDPKSVDACRTLADIAERQNNIEAIEWRRRAVEIAPSSLGDRLALAKTALHFGQEKIAAQTLAEVSPAQQANAEYQATAGHLALTQNNLPAAGQHLREALRIAPNDPHRQLELAEFQLRSGESAQRAQGREVARRLLDNPAVRFDAFHVLIDDALRSRDGSAAIELAKKLDAIPEAPPSDHLLALGILRQLQDPAFAAALTRQEGEAVKSPEAAARLISWMNEQSLALLAIDWSRQFGPEMFRSVALRFSLANSYVQLRDWAALKALLRRGPWDRAESLRLALQAKAARETNDDSGFENSWTEAVAQAGDNAERLKTLQAMAAQWNWPGKAVAILWTLADRRETQKEALQALYKYYAKERDTTGLYRTLSRLVTAMPDDLTVKNNFAQVALLLHVEPERALAYGRDVFAAQPHNAAFVSTYAFGLLQKGDTRGALKAMQTLRPAQLEDPAVATYYGIILAQAGQKESAARYLAEAGKAQLLPEEEKLVSEARAQLDPPRPYSGT